jgi:hypothetical protein
MFDIVVVVVVVVVVVGQVFVKFVRLDQTGTLRSK